MRPGLIAYSHNMTGTWKTSCFVWLDSSTAHNDLTDEAHRLPETELRVLSELKAVPGDLTRIAQRFSSDVERVSAIAREWIERGLIVPSGEDESRKFSVKRVDIETCSHCNARCKFCPQSEQPKQKNFMSAELFDRIVQQIAPYHPTWVSLNAFSEPLLDPQFVDRCRALEERGILIALFTNGTVLRPNVLDYLAGTRGFSRSRLIFPRTIRRNGRN